MSDYEHRISERRLDLIIRSPYWRLVRLFVFASLFSIALVSVFATILPKRNISNFDNNNFSLLLRKKSVIKAQNSNTIEYDHYKESQKLNLKKQNVSLEEIRQALNSGSYTQLGILRPEILGDNIIKETSILPEVKSLVLSRLKVLMNYHDWTNWKEELKGSTKTKSQARIFVDDIITINFQLGRYLETAGLLFSALYNNSANGRIFSPQEVLYGLLQQADQIFQNRTPTAISSKVYLDTLITEDAIFIDALEDLRSSFIYGYYKKEPTEIETHLVLLSTISPNHFTSDILGMYGQLLKHITEKTSPRFREELRAHYLSPEKANRVIDKGIIISDGIFNLYKSGILDYLKSSEVSKAKTNYLQLASIFNNHDKLFEIQKQIDNVAGEINNVEEKVEQVVQLSDHQNESKVKLFPEAKANSSIAKKIETFGIYLGVFVLIFLLIRRFKSNIVNLISSSISNLFGLSLSKAIKSKDDDLIEELDASIKSGKTVPMNTSARGMRKNKKAANL